MKIKIKTKTVLLVILAIFSFGTVVVHAKEQTARLKTSLENDTLYQVVSIGNLNKNMSDSSALSTLFNYDNVVVIGSVDKDVKSKEGKLFSLHDLRDSKKSCQIDSSANNLKDIVNTLSEGDQIIVFGTPSVAGITTGSYEIDATKIIPSPSAKQKNADHIFYDGTAFQGTLVDDLNSKKTVQYYIPKTWQEKYICTPLTNNGIKGYQYSLNALSPINTEYPETFSIFYFINETYLEKPLENASESDNEAVEKEIIKNIVPGLDKDAKIRIEDLSLPNGEIDYYSNNYRPKDGKDYRLEFTFIPDNKGITCMLYLYYPTEEAVNHTKEVSYLIKTIQVSK